MKLKEAQSVYFNFFTKSWVQPLSMYYEFPFQTNLSRLQIHHRTFLWYTIFYYGLIHSQHIINFSYSTLKLPTYQKTVCNFDESITLTETVTISTGSSKITLY